MPKDRPPSFQFYPRDLLTSRHVLLMTPEERGGYLFLLCHAWESDEQGTLPGDDAQLAVLSGLGDRWSACRERILSAFRRRGDGTIEQPRMLQERAAQVERYRQAKKGADATNAVRWTKVAQRPDSESLSGRTAVAPASASASASASAVEPPPTTSCAEPETARAPRPKSPASKDRSGSRREASLDLGAVPAPETLPEGNGGSVGASCVPGRAAISGLPPLLTVSGSAWFPTESELAAWRNAFPGVKLRDEWQRIAAWLLANRTRRKTERGMSRFVHSWLSRQQDRPRAEAFDPYTGMRASRNGE